MSDNPTILRRVAAYEVMIKDRYLLYLSEFFFPLDKGKRQPLFTEQPFKEFGFCCREL